VNKAFGALDSHLPVQSPQLVCECLGLSGRSDL
jgi:hypothetical protein